MDREGKQALATIRECVKADRVLVLTHFRTRLDQRDFYWVDVLAIIEAPGDVRGGGLDQHNRPKWLVSGEGADGTPIEFVCILDENEDGEQTVFVTIYTL